MHITNPSYVTQEMFDTALHEKFIDNAADAAVRQQAIRLVQLFRGSAAYSQVLSDVFHAAKISGHTSTGQVVEIAFAMGLQFGFELALSYPPK